MLDALFLLKVLMKAKRTQKHKEKILSKFKACSHSMGCRVWSPLMYYYLSCGIEGPSAVSLFVECECNNLWNFCIRLNVSYESITTLRCLKGVKAQVGDIKKTSVGSVGKALLSNLTTWVIPQNPQDKRRDPTCLNYLLTYTHTLSPSPLQPPRHIHCGTCTTLHPN